MWLIQYPNEYEITIPTDITTQKVGAYPPSINKFLKNTPLEATKFRYIELIVN